MYVERRGEIIHCRTVIIGEVDTLATAPWIFYGGFCLRFPSVSRSAAHKRATLRSHSGGWRGGRGGGELSKNPILSQGRARTAGWQSK